MARAVEDPTLARLTSLTAARLVLYAILLGAVSVFHLSADAAVAFSTTIRLIDVTIGVAFAAAGVYATWLRTRRGLRALAWTQVVVDQVIWTALVHLSGGPISGATAFYGLSCVLAAITLGVEGVAASALIGGALFVGLVGAYSTGLLHVASADGVIVHTKDFVYPSLATLLALVVVAILAGYLARRLQTQSGELREATERAERAERLAALGRIAAALAHEIRNPLGAIRGSIDIVREAPGLDADEKRLCAIIRNEADRLNDLVSDMMNLAKPREPVYETVDLARLGTDLSELARSAGRGERDVTIRYDGPDHLEVVADGAQVRQLVWNLLRNAVQASSAGTEVVVRVFRSGADGKEGVVEVVDRGAGIPAEMRERIFDAFVTTRVEGVGIGLAVVRQIVDAHGATIDVLDTAGGGTTFRVTLRAKEGRRARAPVPTTPVEAE